MASGDTLLILTAHNVAPLAIGEVSYGTDMDNILRIRRETPNNTNDTMSGDAELNAIYIKET